MTNFPILDLILGMIFIYFLLSIISNSIIEAFMSMLNARAKVLEDWLRMTFNGAGNGSSCTPILWELLKAIFTRNTVNSTKPVPVSTTLADKIMNHPAVAALSADNESPSYMEAANFATALLHLIGGNAVTLDEMKANIKANTSLPENLKGMFLLYITEAQNTAATLNGNAIKIQSDMDIFREKVEKWYNASMDRLTGIIKQRYAKQFTLFIAVLIAIIGNADSIALAKYLYNNPEARGKLAAQAVSSAQDKKVADKVELIKKKIKLDEADQVGIKALNEQNEDVKNEIIETRKKIEAAKSAGKPDTAAGKNLNVLNAQALDISKKIEAINLKSSAHADSVTLESLKIQITQSLNEANAAKATLETSIPIGWRSKEFEPVTGWLDWILFILSKLAGLTITVFAIMMGAPFWFDMLNKIANLRNTGPKPKEEKQ